MAQCECSCGCKAEPIEPISGLDGAFVILKDQYDRRRIICPMCAEDFHRSAWL